MPLLKISWPLRLMLKLEVSGREVLLPMTRYGAYMTELYALLEPFLGRVNSFSERRQSSLKG